MIEFICCGETKYVKSIDDCNLVGDYGIIQNILNKCLIYKDHMEDHVYKPGKSKTNDDTWYCKFCDIVSANMCGGGSRIFLDGMYRKWKNIDYYLAYTAPVYHSDTTAKIQNYPNEKRNKGGKILEGTVSSCLYDTKEHLENWKYYVFNNKLPLFINICLIISQNNTSKKYIPWLVDKQYTDEEIYTLLNISPVEQQLINNTLEKYNRNSQWFKRYLTGKNADK